MIDQAAGNMAARKPFPSLSDLGHSGIDAPCNRLMSIQPSPAMKDVTQIRINDQKVGIVGLQDAIAEAAEHLKDASDNQIGSLLLEKLSKKNYIPSGLHEAYHQAFIREYKRHIGETVIDESGEVLQIKVLGQGCLRCDRLERDIMSVLSENGIRADLEHVRDLEEIGSYGVMGTPALVINGKVKAVGTVPSKTRIKAWLREPAD